MKNSENRNSLTADTGSSQILTARAKVYAARVRLQNASDQADALEAIREIVANLMGSEEVALFKVDAQKAYLWLYWSFGIDPNKYALLNVKKEAKLAEAMAGQIVMRTDGKSENLLSLEVPVSLLIPI